MMTNLHCQNERVQGNECHDKVLKRPGIHDLPNAVLPRFGIFRHESFRGFSYDGEMKTVSLVNKDGERSVRNSLSSAFQNEKMLMRYKSFKFREHKRKLYPVLNYLTIRL